MGLNYDFYIYKRKNTNILMQSAEKESLNESNPVEVIVRIYNS